VLAEEAAAREARQIVGRRQLAVLGERDAQHRLELRDALRGADARLELAVRHAAADTVIRPGREPGLALRGIIELGHVENVGCALGGARPQLAHDLEVVGEHDRTELGLEGTQRRSLVHDRLAVEHVRPDTLLHVGPHGCLLKGEQRLRRRQYAHHHGDRCRGAFLGRRRFLRPSLENPLDYRGMPAAWHPPSTAFGAPVRREITGSRRRTPCGA